MRIDRASAGASAAEQAHRLQEAAKALVLMPVIAICGVVENAVGGLVCECRRSDCRRPGKHPRQRGWHQHATRDADELRNWLEKWPQTNFAGLTGEVVVVDADCKRRADGSVENGAISIEIFEEHYGEPLPHTVSVRSGSGDFSSHRYFQAPRGANVRCRRGLLEGVDVQGHGGIVVLPGSVHVSGRMYEWMPECAPDEVEVAQPTRWLELLLREAADEQQEPEVARRIVQREFDATLKQVYGVEIHSVRIRPQAMPPRWRLERLLSRRKVNHRKIMATWNFQRGPGMPFAFTSGDFSTSAYELSLATYAACNKWPPQDIVDLLVFWRRHHSLDLERLHRARAICTLRKAYQTAIALGGIRQKPGRRPSPLRERALELLQQEPKLTYSELGRRLGISEAAAKMLFFRMRHDAETSSTKLSK